jgi:phosphosulfolactate synthase (CoM biosynthesis protein A)
MSTQSWKNTFPNAKSSGVPPIYLDALTNVGSNMSYSFDVIELSSGFLSFPGDDWLRLVDKVHSYGLKAKPELGIQFGARGDTSASELSSIGTSDPSKLVNLGKRFLDASVERPMIESEGIAENVKAWRTDLVSQIMKELPPEKSCSRRPTRRSSIGTLESPASMLMCLWITARSCSWRA